MVMMLLLMLVSEFKGRCEQSDTLTLRGRTPELLSDSMADF
jgi:hypothetical protein